MRPSREKVQGWAFLLGRGIAKSRIESLRSRCTVTRHPAGTSGSIVAEDAT